MDLNKLILVNNDCYKAGRKITPKGIMWHSTGANNPNLKRYVGPDDGILGKNQYNNHWNQARPDGRQVCVHAFIGKDKNGKVRTYQTLPWNHRGWHAGGKANDTHIGFEICEDGLTDKTYFDKVYQEAIDLTVYLCKMYNLTEKDVIDHQEGYKKGIASNHGDVKHWFSRFGKSMNDVRADIKKQLGGNPIKKNYLYLGDTGNDVKKLQQDLINLGYNFGKYGADGSFGNATLETVKKFQKDNKLKVDGYAGPDTQNKIKELLSIPKPSPTKPKPTGAIYRVIVDGKQVGAYGNLENILRNAEDGILKNAKEVLIQRV